MADRHDAFRTLIDRDEIALVPGCFDALSGKVLEKAGFDAAYLSGAGVSNTKLGIADTGLVTQTEMRRRIEYLTDAVSVPVFADADEGYGNPLHVRRTVQAYEREGASGLHIEDQSFPKRCGHFENKELIGATEMTRKVDAAVEAREDPRFVIIARTDARAVEGMSAAIDRANQYLAAGADLIFPEAPQDEAEMQRFCDEIDGPVMANMVEYGKTPMKSASELEAIGFDLVIFPNSVLRAAMQTMVDTAAHIKEHGRTDDILDQIASFELRNEITDKDHVDELNRRYEA